MPSRCFPPPWTVDLDACFVVKDSSGQKLGYVYYEEETGFTSERAGGSVPRCSFTHRSKLRCGYRRATVTVRRRRPSTRYSFSS